MAEYTESKLIETGIKYKMTPTKSHHTNRLHAPAYHQHTKTQKIAVCHHPIYIYPTTIRTHEVDIHLPHTQQSTKTPIPNHHTTI